MEKNNMISFIWQEVAAMLLLSQNTLTSLMDKYGLKEIRKTNFFWIGYLWTIFTCMFQGTCRHKDRVTCYNGKFGNGLTESISSDRLSAIKTGFFREVLNKIMKEKNAIHNRKKRRKVHQLIRMILAEDATVFNLDKRLIQIFKRLPGSNAVGLKLYTSLSVFGGGCLLKAKIKTCRSADVKHKSKKYAHTIELRDRGWFSMPLFVELVNEDRYFISRIQKSFNPMIVGVCEGESSWKGSMFQSIELGKWDEVDIEVKPYRGKDTIYRLKNGKTFTIRMKGKRSGRKDWYWYIYHLPKEKSLRYSDIHALYRARWNIEMMFREMKQGFGGDHIRLTNGVSIENHLYMMLICYVILKGFISEVSRLHRKSEDGFVLDRVMRGYMRMEVLRVYMLWIRNRFSTQREFMEETLEFVRSGYSSKRAMSGRKSSIGKAMKKLNG